MATMFGEHADKLCRVFGLTPNNYSMAQYDETENCYYVSAQTSFHSVALTLFCAGLLRLEHRDEQAGSLITIDLTPENQTRIFRQRIDDAGAVGPIRGMPNPDPEYTAKKIRSCAMQAFPFAAKLSVLDF